MSRVLRAAPTASLITLSGALWHVLLLKSLREQPLLFLSLLLLWFGVVLWARGRARAVSPSHRTRVEHAWASCDRIALTWVAFFLILLALFHWGFERAASDGREYYVQVRSLVLDRDLDFTNENEVFGVRAQADRYAFGAPLLWAPFFVLAHVWLALLNLFGGGYPLDGYFNPYQRAIGLGTLCCGFAGLVLVYRVLADYFSRLLALASTVALCTGSFIVWYLTVENSMVHGPSMFATTLFLYLWHRGRAGRTRLQWVLLGFAAGLMAMVRWQDVLFLVAPIAYSLYGEAWSRQSAAAPAGVPRSSVRDSAGRVGIAGALFAGGLLVGFSPQMFFWRIVRGAWISPPAAEHGFDPGTLYVGDILFSPHHGLFSWTPLFYLALLGLPLFYRRDAVLTVVLLVGFLAQVYVNAAVEVWWGGSGFGARRFANSALVFGVGLAAAIDLMRRRPAIPIALALGTLVGGQWLLMLGVRSGRLPSGEGVPFDRMFAEVYERVGNPFSLPFSAMVAWTNGASMTLYDQQRGRTFNNLEIDIGEESDTPYLGSGWADGERSSGYSFRWAVGPESIVVAPLRAADDYRIELDCTPLAHASISEPQTIEVRVNGRYVGHVGFDAPGVPAIDVPGRFMRANRNQIRLRYAYAVSPEDLGLSGDPRRLAIQCDWIRFLRAGSGPA